MNRLLPLLLIAAVSCSFSSFGLNGDDISSTGTCVALEPALENPPGGCATPDVPTTSNATSSSFDVAWTCGFCSGGESFIVEYGLAGFTPGTGAGAGVGGTILGAATSPETLFGLDPATSYDVYVRSDCGGTYSSNTAVVSQSTTAPPGDVCTDAIAITCGASLSGNTSLGFANEPLAPCGTINDGAPSVWYVASGTGAGMTASLCGSSYDTKVFVFEGNCGVMNCVDGSDDFCGTQSEVSWTSTLGTDYYIIVSGSGASSGAYTLSLSCDPTNDVCADAIPITCGQTISATTVGSTDADAEAVACGTSTSGLAGIWYSFVGDGRTVTLSTCDQAAYDTKLAVYSGACGALVCVDGNDDGPGCSGFTSELDVATDCGEQYYVYVTGFLGATGTFDLTMSCAGATVVTQDATVTLDGNGEFNFNSPILPQVDVEVTSTNTVVSAISSWQSFTATTDGILHEVTFGVGATAPGPYTLTVYQGEDNTGTALFSQFVATAQTPNSTVSLPLAGTLDLTSGMEYTIEVSSAASFDWLADSGNPYAGGVSSSAGSDLVFSVSLLERPIIDNGSSSAVGIASFEVSPSTITCANVGAAETVSLVAIDNDGNSASCTAMVDAIDNTLPTALCATATALSTAASGVIATVIPDNNTGSVVETLNIPDNGLIVDVDVDVDIDHTWAGDIEVTLESPAGTIVTLIDRPGTTGGGGCSGDNIVVTLDDDAPNAVEDECAGSIPTINGTFSPNGLLSAFNGQNASGTWTITVVDHAIGDVGRLNEWGLSVTRSIPGNQQLYLDASGNLNITAADVDGGSFDGCGIDFMSVSPNSFTCADIGTPQPITLSVTDVNGNSNDCNSNLDILDTISPVAICQNLTVYLDGSGNGSITAGDIDNGSSDNCGTANLSASVTAFTCADIGLNNVTLTVDDGNGNMSTCVAAVTVADTISPSITCPGTQTEFLSATCDFVLPDYTGLATVSDNCNPSPTVIQSPPAGTLVSGITTTTVTLIADDVNGNNASCTFDVQTVDAIPPSAVCQNITLFLDGSGNGTIVAADVDGGSADNCGAVTLSVSATSFTCADIGANTVTLTVEDGSTNTSTCNATVTVVDTVSPIAVCQDITIYVDGTGNASITASDLDGGSSDNCGLDAPSASMTSFDCNFLGPNPVVFTANDLSGNSDTCTAIVTTLDTINPVITCPVFTPQCGDNSTGGIATFATPTATDNCTVTTVTQIDVTGLSSGSFFPTGTTTLTFVAADGTGNTDTCSFDVVILPQPDADFSHSPACIGEAIFFTDQSVIDPSGTITSWSWDMGDGSAAIGVVDPIHSYAAVGDYTVSLTVTSADGCTSTFSQVISVTEVPTASFTATTECNGVGTVFTNNWSIDPGYAGGVNFFWDFGDGTTSTDENPVHAFPTNGTFTVTLTVTTDDGCEDIFSAPVTVNGLPTALAIASTECEGNATQFTDLSVGSGLSWSWDFGDGNSSAVQHPTHTYATAGSYTYMLTVTTGAGCVASTSGTVVVNDEPVVDFAFSNMCEGTVVDFTNGSTPGTNAWDFGDGNSSILSDVSNTYINSGVYNVVLTVTSAEGCVASLAQPITIFDNPEFTLTATDVACYNIPTGEIQVNMSVGVPPITYSINGMPGQSTGLFTGLAEGMHTITVSDNNGCFTTDSIMVNQPSDTLGVQLISTTNIDCHGTNSGAIELVGTGGTAAYTYLIGGVPQSTGLFTGLPAGSHNIQLIDFNNCPFDTTIVLTEPDTLILMTDTIGNLLCNGDSSGFLGISAMGGVTPYSYSLNGVDFQSGDMFNGLAAGGYTVTVMDSLGCSDTVNVTVTEPGILQLSLLSSTDALCNGQATGTILVGASSGTPGYTYSIDGGANWQGNADFPGVAAGTHTIMVMDDNGCLDSTSVSISEPTVLTMSSTSTPVLCSGEATGSISLNALGGTPGYTYSNDGGGNYQSSSDFNGLAAGSYVMVVLDTNGCTVSESVVITEPSTAISATSDVVNVGCIGDSTGSVLVLATGGTGAFQYSIDNGVNWQNSNAFSDIPAGSYSVLVEDGNGCQTTVGFSVTEPANALQISNVLANSPFCAGEQTGSLTIQAFGGTPSYTYSVDGGVNFGPDAIVTGLGQGTYNVVVLDTNGCSVSQSVQLVDPDSIVLSIDTVIGVDCEGDLTGQIVASATGGTGTLMYSIDGGTPQSDGTFSSLMGGNYTITVTDVNNCSAQNAVDVVVVWGIAIPDFDYIVSGETVSFNNLSQNGNSYSWDFGDGNASTEENPIHMYDSPGNYSVTLTVTNECGDETITYLVSTVTFGINQVENIANVSIYPNPSNGLITFTAELSQPVENLSIDILDMRGRAVWTRSMNNASGTLNESMDLSHLAQGVYQLQVGGDAWRSVHRVSISR